MTLVYSPLGGAPQQRGQPGALVARGAAVAARSQLGREEGAQLRVRRRHRQRQPLAGRLGAQRPV